VSIQTLKPNVTREQALSYFSGRGIKGAIRRMALGPLRSLGEIYIPFRLCRVEIINRGHREQRLFGVDAVNGSLDLYAFEGMPDASQLLLVETRNRPAPLLDEAACCSRLVEKLRRLLFLTGFFRMHGLTIHAEPLAVEIHVPYWVGFFGRGEQVHPAILDAVRRRAEGAKVRQLVQAWLAGGNAGEMQKAEPTSC